MAQATFHFPRGFLWGCATSSHQVEGNNFNNNWWAWEQQPGRILNGDKSGPACDWWGGRWRDDFERAAEGHQNAHRFSVEWSRIQPVPDKWDEHVLDRYREMARNLTERNMTPLVTLHHFSDPLWLAEKGGWENEAVVEDFARFTRKVVEALNEYVNLWVTINEPNLVAVQSYLFGVWPPGKTDIGATLRVMANLARAHAAAYHAIHEIQNEARVGIALHVRAMAPAYSASPLDRLAAGIYHSALNELLPRLFQTGVLHYPGWRRRLPEAKGTQDYLGINYYTQDLVAFRPFNVNGLFAHRYFPAEAELSETGMLANIPQALFATLKWGLRFNVPMIITENGVEDSQDAFRRRYLIQHLHQVWRAVNFNYPVKGYFHWSLVDNFEWERGWTQRFGLWELDVETQKRSKRPSADLYAEICQENGLSSEMVARYAPEVFSKLFPS
jgi:beta-glucosidase